MGDVKLNFEQLLGEYWCLAYREGLERRTQDTEAGDAQRVLSAIRADYLALRAECEGLRADAERYRWLRDAKPNALHLSRNGDHACNYMTASAWIDESEEWFAETPPEEIQRMRDTDTIWELQIYPDTPIGSYTYYASTLDAAIDAGREG